MMNIETVVKEYINERFASRRGQEHVLPDQSLLTSGLIDSTGIFELVTFLEDRFGIEIIDEEILPEHFETIRQITQFMNTKLKGSDRGAEDNE